MKINTFILFITTLLGFIRVPEFVFASSSLGPFSDYYKRSPGGPNYFIDPVNGRDANSGRFEHKAWKSFDPAGEMFFSAGDHMNRHASPSGEQLEPASLLISNAYYFQCWPYINNHKP